MNLLIILPIALALAMDAFAVSLGIGLSLTAITRKQTLRVALAFGLFQFLMPVVGWFAGENALKYFESFDHWVAFGLLTFIGGRMIFESFRFEEKSRTLRNDPTRGWPLLVLSVATSIDALAVGLSLAALHVAIFLPAVIIGVVAFLMTITGVKLGPLFGRILGRRAEFLGGMVLVLIGIKILTEHL